MALTFCLALCGCGGGGQEPQDNQDSVHVHNYRETVIEPAHGVQGCVLHTCDCGSSYSDNYLGASGEALPTNRSYTFLMIGNSYTYVNDLWSMFNRVIQDEGYLDAMIDHVTEGGYDLIRFSNPTDPFGSIVEDRLNSHQYDFIFYQDQSLFPATSPDLFITGAKRMHDRIQKTGTRDVLYMTWGRKPTSPDLAANNLTYEQHAQKVMAAYEAVGEKEGIPVSRVGAAFYLVNASHPEIELYNADMTHPSAAGSYLAALCHFATVFGRSPVGCTFYPLSITEEQAGILQQAAHDAVFGDSLVKEEYRAEYKALVDG